MKIIFFGTPHFVIPIFKILKDNFHLVGVVTAPDKKSGRKQIITPSPIKVACESYYPNSIESKTQLFTPLLLDNVFISEIEKLKPDLFVTAAYGKLLPHELLKIPKYGAVNVHPSLLPKYRGTSPIQTTLLQGDRITGVTIYQLDEKMDHGPIIAQQEVEISEKDTLESLHEKLFKIGAEMLENTLPKYETGQISPKDQDHTRATFSKKLTRESGYIDVNIPPSKVILKRMIRAYHPWPGVWGTLRIKNEELRVKLLPQQQIQIEGKNPMTYKDFMNGYPDLKEFFLKLF